MTFIGERVSLEEARRLLSRVGGRSYWFFGDAMIFRSMLLRLCVILVCVGGGFSSFF